MTSKKPNNSRIRLYTVRKWMNVVVRERKIVNATQPMNFDSDPLSNLLRLDLKLFR